MRSEAGDSFLAARDQLLQLREDWVRSVREFHWPSLPAFNWAIDVFDRLSSEPHPALRIVDDQGGDRSVSFAELRARSNQVAHFLRASGLAQGDRVLILLGSIAPLWETILGVWKLGAVVVPASTLLTPEEIRQRIERGAIRAVVADGALVEHCGLLPGSPIRVAVGSAVPGWINFGNSYAHSQELTDPAATLGDDPLLLYFTSGTTAHPKLVLHTHGSYPVGHLSTMYWLGLKPGDVHLNLSSPGWAKHAWSSVFAPWNAGATVVAYQYERFQPKALLNLLVRARVTSICAPPTVWRMLVQENLERWPVTLREIASAGEPLSAQIIDQVQRAWGLSLRDGFGQSETTALVGNSPGQPVKPGSMGRPLPGHNVVLLAADGTSADEGEICVAVGPATRGVMRGYSDDEAKTAEVMRDGYYHTGDWARRDSEGYLIYVGRGDDVFKSSDYRISPFELESVLIEHAAVAEAAVVPSPDAMRLAVPKAFVLLAAGFAPDRSMAAQLIAYVRSRVSPFKRIRRVEFAALPKTLSGKIRRRELRETELHRDLSQRRPAEYWEEDLIETQLPP